MSQPQVSQYCDSLFTIFNTHSSKIEAGDILVDGLVALTFAPGDADNYFKVLLKTPASQYFLLYYGIVHHEDAWYITHNVNLVQRDSPGVPLQTTPLLDYSVKRTHGTVVPQMRWTPADTVDIQRHVEGAALNLPIFFVNRDGSLGFPLLDILRGCDRNLHDANGFAPLGGRSTTHIRINVSLYTVGDNHNITRS